MFEHEYRPREQISREDAESLAIMVAIATRKADAKRVRQQKRRGAMRAEPAEAQ